ncbi:Protein KTI12 [Seminavis robusta]|uniref:Protein KTI12 n=1 Tax=Seminavis robusta TaxID=568900 RepID=A0A9N8EL34_9STRA|nr:Protein KTI12 [Seminavis robusta]|eukprot:Sro1390_g268710.1 Protein KTI12 (509) ;mRNA; f:27292-28818
MPCLILTGHPCVGKTTLAEVIKERALQHSSHLISSVVIVNEEMACPGLTKAQCYLNSHNEKKTRGALKTCFDQAVVGGSASKAANEGQTEKHQQQLVILDSLNYIKGFRYELHCISKSAGRQHGVIWVLNSMDLAKEWNQKRNQQQQQSEAANSDKPHYYYSDATIDELILRYEPPDERNRWDKPLYKVDMRPQELKSQQQNQQGKTAGEILEKSVYNMHALSDVMGSTGQEKDPAQAENGGVTRENTSDTTATAAAPKKKGFKGFKRAPKTAKPLAATVISAAPSTGSSNNATDNNPLHSNNANNPNSQDEPILYPKDFLYSSKPSEQPIHTDASSMDGINDFNTNNNDNPQLRGGDAPSVIRRGPKKAPRPAPKQPDPLTSVEEQVDCILDAFLLHVKPLQEGSSTRPHVAVSANALHEMDAVTQSVCDTIVRGGGGVTVGRIPIVLSQSSKQQQLFLKTHRTLSPAELKRLRRQYLRWVGAHPPEDCETEYGIAESFVSYIEAQL